MQLAQEDFVRKFLGILEEFDLPGKVFEVEITELGLTQGRSGLVEKLQRLRESGVSVAIDDFGRGYSSLSYLQDFPVNTLKIDRAFVRDIEEDRNESRIVDAIALMARGLNLNFVAEGVENLLQLDYLRNLGCQEVQGYLFAEAMSAKDTMLILGSHPEEGPRFILPH